MSDPALEWGFELGWRMHALESVLVGGGWKRGGMGLTVRVQCDDGDGGLWTAVGDDGERREVRTAESADEATALVQEAFGMTAWRPQPPPPPGWQRFTLIHCPVGVGPGCDDARYDGLKAQPPQGCVPGEIGGYFGLRCERPGARLLDAVADTCAEVRAGHGLLMTDLGIEKLWEWSSDGPDGWGAEIVGQLLLMAAERGPELGYSVDDMARFLRTAAGA
ncbi:MULTISPECIES: hypothetical protein [unclassified Streptomyces]|uniref:hypothetical protein n=1 Tax=unclassified Streptomyces TaxID=2593676 RepID=UPI001EF7EE52|nr:MULTISPECIES: hypothetical protein [unclassified Streptomyces]